MLGTDTCAGKKPANFGGKRRGAVTPGLFARGNRSHIQAPTADCELDHLHVCAVRVIAEAYSSGESDSGLIQVGFAQSNELPVDDCGYRTTLHNFWEYKVSVAGAPTHCAWLDGVPVQYGKSKLYTVFRKLQSTTITNVTTWEARIEGTQQLVVNVKFNGADDVAATGELTRDKTNALSYAHGGVSGCYGCSGSSTYPTPIQWQMTTTAGSSGWADQTEANSINVNSDGNWVIGTIPAWTVKHPYTPP